MAEFKTIANTSDIPEGQGKILEVGGNPIAVWQLNGNFYAFQNVCPHRGGPVGEGELEGNIITSPWHGHQFDITTCVSPTSPVEKLKGYEVKVEGNEVKVNL